MLTAQSIASAAQKARQLPPSACVAISILSYRTHPPNVCRRWTAPSAVDCTMT